MEYQRRYLAAKPKLLNDASICSENRILFKEFFIWQEYKLKRINGLTQLDDATYRTLNDYVTRFRTVSRWFENKPWNSLTKDDIKQVYDALEDGRILTLQGKPFKDRGSYYRKILLSKPFELAGKKELVKEVMAFQMNQPRNEVRFIREATFREIIDAVSSPKYRTLLWLAWDIGENARSLLQLRKQDFTRSTNTYSQEPEYRVNLRRETLKRSRTPRTEVTNYKETVALLDRTLEPLSDSDRLFQVGWAAAAKVLRRAVLTVGAKCIPNGEMVTLKDLRSSMACDLLSKGWTTDEVNQRLGHRPSSREIDKYVNWLALGRDRPKRRLHDNQMNDVHRELQEVRDRESLLQQRLRAMQAQMAQLQEHVERNNRAMFARVEKLIQGAKGRNQLGLEIVEQ